MLHILPLTSQILNQTIQTFHKLNKISVTKMHSLVIARPKEFIEPNFHYFLIDASYSGFLMGHSHHHDPGIDEVEEVVTILLVVVVVGNKLLDFLNKQVNFMELFFHNLDFSNQHTAGKVDSKN